MKHPSEQFADPQVALRPVRLVEHPVLAACDQVRASPQPKGK
jgi:hypothetical protein